MSKHHRFAIRVTWPKGEDECLREGAEPDGPIAKFTSRARARDQVAFMAEGFDVGDIQNIAVVPYPVSQQKAHA